MEYWGGGSEGGCRVGGGGRQQGRMEGAMEDGGLEGMEGAREDVGLGRM